MWGIISWSKEETDFFWHMRVERDRSREPEPLDSKVLEKSQRRYSAKLYKSCDVPKRNRFNVTAYIGRRGQVLSAGAVPTKKAGWEKIECILTQLKHWKLPPQKKLSKVMFKLRWRPPK